MKLLKSRLSILGFQQDVCQLFFVVLRAGFRQFKRHIGKVFGTFHEADPPLVCVCLSVK